MLKFLHYFYYSNRKFFFVKPARKQTSYHTGANERTHTHTHTYTEGSPQTNKQTNKQTNTECLSPFTLAVAVRLNFHHQQSAAIQLTYLTFLCRHNGNFLQPILGNFHCTLVSRLSSNPLEDIISPPNTMKCNHNAHPTYLHCISVREKVKKMQ